MQYSPRDITEWNLKNLLRSLKMQGVTDEDLRDALLAMLEDLK